MTTVEHLKAEVDQEVSFWKNIGEAFKGGHKIFMIIGTVLLTGCLVCLGIIISKQIDQERRAAKYQEFREKNLENQKNGLEMLKELNTKVDSMRSDQIRWHWEARLITIGRDTVLNKIKDALAPESKLSNGLYKIKKQ